MEKHGSSVHHCSVKTHIPSAPFLHEFLVMKIQIRWEQMAMRSYRTFVPEWGLCDEVKWALQLVSDNNTFNRSAFLQDKQVGKKCFLKRAKTIDIYSTKCHTDTVPSLDFDCRYKLHMCTDPWLPRSITIICEPWTKLKANEPDWL